MPSLIEFSFALQLVALIVVAFKGSGKLALTYMVSLPFVWFIVLELISGHVAVATHLLWIVPVVWVSVVALLTHTSKGTG